jgi:hypothetical protein
LFKVNLAFKCFPNQLRIVVERKLFSFLFLLAILTDDETKQRKSLDYIAEKHKERKKERKTIELAISTDDETKQRKIKEFVIIN